jgi:hypothetical protein
MYCPPGDVTGVHWVIGAAGSDFANPAGGSSILTGQAILQPVVENVNGPDVVGFAPDTDNTLGTSRLIPTLAYDTAAAPVEWRITHSGLTVYLDANATADQGMVYATQVSGRTLRDFPCFANKEMTTADPVAIMAFRPFIMPSSEEAIRRYDPSSYQNRANKGVYIPVQRTEFDGFVQPASYAMPATIAKLFVPGSLPTPGIRDIMIFPTSGYGADALKVFGSKAAAWLLPCTQDEVTGNITRSDWWAAAFDGNYDHLAMPETGLDDVAVPVLIFRGLSASASLSLKRTVGFELVPSDASGSLPFIRKPAPYSPAAIDLYQRITAMLPSAFPAKFNSWGSILRVIGDVASNLAPAVSMIPEFGPVLGGIAGAIGSSATAISSLDSKRKADGRAIAQLELARHKTKAGLRRIEAASRSGTARKSFTKKMVKKTR